MLLHRFFSRSAESEKFTDKEALKDIDWAVSTVYSLLTEKEIDKLGCLRDGEFLDLETRIRNRCKGLKMKNSRRDARAAAEFTISSYRVLITGNFHHGELFVCVLVKALFST